VTDHTSEQESVETAAAAESTEVRPEELSQGTAEPIGRSAFPDELVTALRRPLDPNRVRRRKGRGGSQYEYLAGHDVKRRANELFGFGNWGHRIASRELLAAVEVVSNNREGWHVGYATVVSIWVRIGDGPMFNTEGVGYGDGVEYGPAARVQACELAIKESETDALKRAFTDLGDQFGLILYAADDEKKRIERETSRESTTGRVVRQETTEHPSAPRTQAEALERLVDATAHPREDWVDWWLPQLIEHLTPGKTSTREMTQAERNVLGQKLGTVVLELDQYAGGATPPSRQQIQEAFALVTDGEILEGPAWRIGPEEEDLPTLEEYAAEAADVGAAQDHLNAERTQQKEES